MAKSISESLGSSAQERIISIAGILFGSVLGIQVISFLLSTIFPSLSILTLGPVLSLIIMGLVVLGVFSIVLGVSFNKITTGDVIIILAVLAGLVILVFQAPNLIPEIFDKQAIMAMIGG